MPACKPTSTTIVRAPWPGKSPRPTWPNILSALARCVGFFPAGSMGCIRAVGLKPGPLPLACLCNAMCPKPLAVSGPSVWQGPLPMSLRATRYKLGATCLCCPKLSCGRHAVAGPSDGMPRLSTPRVGAAAGLRGSGRNSGRLMLPVRPGRRGRTMMHSLLRESSPVPATPSSTRRCSASASLPLAPPPPELAPHLAGAALFAIPKGADDVRPIAVGETLRRLVGKCMCQAYKEESRSLLWPLQVGVGVPLGGETVVHAVRNWAHRHAGHVSKVILKVDFSNAFNTVDRGALLRQVRLHMPGLSAWAEWTYGRHSRLLFGDACLSSEAGVQQGDPLGPLLFARALHPALQAARAGPAPPSLALAFLDDVCLAGDYRHVAASLARLAAAARQVGLELNPSKCELVVCGGADHCVDTSLFPAGVQVNGRGAFSFLGAPIGPPAYCEAFCLAERVEKAKPLLALLATLPDPQTALLLLRHCASFCRVAYSARVTPPSLHCNALAVFDGAVRACLESVCTGPLAAEAWVQCTLATSVGGLGLRLARRHAPAAYIASLVSTAASCLALDPGYDLANHSAYLASVTAHNQDVMPSDHLPVPVPPNTRQRQLSQALDRAVVAQLLAPGQGREAARAHFHLLQQPGAGAWLHAPPSEALGLHVVPRLFRVMVQLRLRLAVVPTDAACPLCDGVADRFGDHSRSCPCGGDGSKGTTAFARLWLRGLGLPGSR